MQRYRNRGFHLPWSKCQQTHYNTHHDTSLTVEEDVSYFPIERGSHPRPLRGAMQAEHPLPGVLHPPYSCHATYVSAAPLPLTVTAVTAGGDRDPDP